MTTRLCAKVFGLAYDIFAKDGTAFFKLFDYGILDEKFYVETSPSLVWMDRRSYGCRLPQLDLFQNIFSRRFYLYLKDENEDCVAKVIYEALYSLHCQNGVALEYSLSLFGLCTDAGTPGICRRDYGSVDSRNNCFLACDNLPQAVSQCFKLRPGFQNLFEAQCVYANKTIPSCVPSSDSINMMISESKSRVNSLFLGSGGGENLHVDNNISKIEWLFDDDNAILAYAGSPLTPGMWIKRIYENCGGNSLPFSPLNCMWREAVCDKK